MSGRPHAYEIVVIGASLGGRQAIETLLAGLPPDFPLSVIVVLHRGRDSDETLAAMLQARSPLPVEEAEDKQALRPARVYLAPADYHLLVEDGHAALSTEAPVWNSRPSIDVLFESAADAYREKSIGVILTGSSHDGARGLARIKQAGGAAVVQDPETAEAKAMPKAALNELQAVGGVPDRSKTGHRKATAVQVLQPEEIAPFLVELVSAKTGERR